MGARFLLRPGGLGLGELRTLLGTGHELALDADCWPGVDAAAATVANLIAAGETVYGVNTGFGILANTAISADQVAELQRRLVLSHMAGVGPSLPDPVVRLILILKIASLARGHSGVRRRLIEGLVELVNAGITPVVPAKGSVGASGDLAPLAHMSAALIGVGEVRVAGATVAAARALADAGLEPMALAAKEGLALLNGSQVSTALALAGLFAIENVFAAAIVAGALTTDACLGSDAPFAPRIQAVRGQQGQVTVAALLTALLEDSEIRHSHLDCDRVQDPYSLRCQPQVMGACLDQMRFNAGILEREANAVSDNPLVFADTGEVVSGGNFHAEPVAMAADVLALALAEIGALSERRMALLIDPHFSSLPAFLVAEPGLNSGFMSAQITAAALASENKALAHPAVVDSLPTSANQEDHVSMATFAARRLGDMAENAAGIVAIELLAAAQGIEMRRPHATSPRLATALAAIRERAPFLETDRPMSPDIRAVSEMVTDGWFRRHLNFAVAP